MEEFKMGLHYKDEVLWSHMEGQRSRSCLRSCDMPTAQTEGELICHALVSWYISLL